jgi:hypothetical protein
MRLALAFAALLLAASTAACGADETAGSVHPSAPASGSGASDAVSATPTTPAAPTYRLLSKRQLESTLLAVRDLPPGYSQDPPSTDSGNKNFCDYKAPAQERLRVRRDFTKGGGMSAELASISLRQFASVPDAKAAWRALTKALRTCHSEVYEGTRLAYSEMSAPRLGDDSVGVKIDADGTALLQNFVLAGPTVISAGGGGLTNADADAISKMLKTQVHRYVSAARK